MAKVVVTLDGVKHECLLVLPRHVLVTLPESLLLSMLKPFIDIRGLALSVTCCGYYLVYRRTNVVGRLKVLD